MDSKEVEISFARIPKKFESNYKPFNHHLSNFKISGNLIVIIDKAVEKRATSSSINITNTSAIQNLNGVVNVPHKTVIISFQEFNCSKIIFRINWNDGSNDDFNLDFNYKITGIS